MTNPRRLSPIPLTAERFRAYGDVIETAGADHFGINQGTTERFHDLATVEVGAGHGARALINIFRGSAREYPLDIVMMEKHPLGSQAFVPLGTQPYLVVVAPPMRDLETDRIEAFVARANQGVNYAPGVWHHPLLVWRETSEFLVVDRGGPGDNLVERAVEPGTVQVLAPSCSQVVGPTSTKVAWRNARTPRFSHE